MTPCGAPWRWGLVGFAVSATLGCAAGEETPRPTALAVESQAPEAASQDAYAWERVEPTAECLQAMTTTADEPDSGLANPLIIATLSECTSTAEWLSALEREPGALGMTERAEIGRLDLEVSCWGNESTPVCADAIAIGALDPVE